MSKKLLFFDLNDWRKPDFVNNTDVSPGIENSREGRFFYLPLNKENGYN
jgi:hypothetical protein